jgi:type VI secretion system protein ImpG
MDERFLQLYDNELRHLRSTAGEFAKEFPRIAGQLGIDPDGQEEVEDPYVERLLEGFAYLTSRVQLKMDAEFPRVSQGLLETIYPDYLSPTPSMAIVQLQPVVEDPGLMEGVPVPRGTKLRSRLGKGERTPCEFVTAHDLTLWPIEIQEVSYHTSRDLGRFQLPKGKTEAQAALRIRLKAMAGAPFSEMTLDRLVFYLRGADQLPVALYENIVGGNAGAVLHSHQNMRVTNHFLGEEVIEEVGFGADEALLPPSPRGFEGYRLLREYFAFPQRYLFFGVNDFASSLAKIDHDEVDLLILLKNPNDERLGEGRIDSSSLALHATPAINLFEKRTDRVNINPGGHEHLVMVDRTKPRDYEVYAVEQVIGHGGERQEFLPFFRARDDDGTRRAFYTLNRRERPLTVHERERKQKVPSYLGSDVHISLVDSVCSPYHSDLRELGIRTLCTNRHLPLAMARGLSTSDFEIEINEVKSIRCLTGPTRPLPSYADGDVYWRLISHLRLNYTSLLDDEENGGAVALRELLNLYVTDLKKGSDKQIQQRQVEGLLSVKSKPITKRLADGPGRIAFVRGLEITVRFDEQAFEGFGVFVIGAVLERFFAKHVSTNSFTQTAITSEQRGEIHRWPVRIGKKVLI